MLWLKLISPFKRTGGSSREKITNVRSKLNVNEEYMEAFRTKSYSEIWSKVQCQMRRRREERLSSLSPFPSYSHLSDNLLEPKQDILIDMIKSSDLHHHLLMDYFKTSLEASRICGFLLESIDQTRTNYSIVQRVVKMTKRVPNFTDYTDDQCRFIFNELAAFADIDNPLAGSSPMQFRIIRDQYVLMLDKLLMTHKKIARKLKLISLCKKASRVGLILACDALAILTLVLMVHSLVGIAAAPGLVIVPLVFLKRRIKSGRRELKTSKYMRLGAQLDAAAKGVYILNRDFETMGRLVLRLHDEIEHGKSIARLYVRNQKRHMLKEVVKEFQRHECCLLEQLGELEEHVYLCFLTINRARRLVIQEAMLDSHRQQQS